MLTFNKRSKNTTKIWHVHKLKDKARGGYVMGQGLVFMAWVTPIITTPVGVEFYRPDPDYTAWKKKYDTLKKEGVPARERPSRPAKNADFPTREFCGDATYCIKYFEERKEPEARCEK